MLKLTLTTLLLTVQPANACHRFTQWHYLFPQRCSIPHPHTTITPLKPTYYVEITSPPPIPQSSSDERTPDQIADFNAYNLILSAHKDELNTLLTILHTNEATKGSTQ